MLKHKLFRDIKNNLSQFITIFLMLFIGVMVYSGIESYMTGMTSSANNYYSKYNLQDLNLLGEKFSKDDLETIKKINNVKNAERKLTLTATDASNKEKTYLVNFIESNDIAKFYLYDGIKFDKDKSGVWVDSSYIQKNNLKLGDTLKIKYDTFILEEKIVGIINVPDHVYDVKDASELYPDHSNFGYIYLSINEFPENYIKEQLIKKMNIEDESFDEVMPNFNYMDYIPFNTIMVDVKDKSKLNKVKDDIEDNVASAKAIINIEDTTSYATYQGEIDEGKTYVGVFSGLFIFIAMLAVVTTMTRVVKKQKIQIGTLKALGFSKSKINFHYISYGLYISVVSAIVGLIAGRYLIGSFFMNMQMSFFEMPDGHAVMNPKSYVVALLVVLLVSFITYLTCRKELRKNPAETLRAELPNVKKNSLNITTKGIFKKLNFSVVWNLRDMLRNKTRTLTGIAGVVGCCMLIVCAFGMLNSMNYFIKLQFDRLYNFDYKLSLKENITDSELNELIDKYGNHTFQTLGIEIKNKNQRESNNIFVTDADNYVRFVNKKNKFIKINSNKGVFVTYKLAENNGYKIGDKIKWHIYGDKKYYESEIVGFNKDPQNQNITMTREYLESLGIKYTPDSLYTNLKINKNESIKNVELIQDIENLKDGMNSMLKMMKSMITLIIVIACLLGAIIIYNMGILSYTEKEYQFATLKVLGFKDKQIRKIYIKQNIWISVISIIIGCPTGFYLTDWLFKTAIEESYDFSANINISTYLIAAIGTFLVTIFVSKFLSKKVNKIDMVSSLKGNE